MIDSEESPAQWLSWLERRPVTAEVTGSSPVWVVCSDDDVSVYVGSANRHPAQAKDILLEM